ncbi:glycosyltransferase family 4 protein [Desulfocastanea catecholica]
MKILHIISQHPESTGSGFYVQNIIRQAAAAGHENFLVAGISGHRLPKLDCIDRQFCRFVHFEVGDLAFKIPGMSDVMPYASSRFSDLTVNQLAGYEQSFAETIHRAVDAFSPDIVHSHHLWLVSSIARRVITDIPLVTSCHSTDLRQFIQCPQLGQKVLPRCQKIDRVLALSREQKENIQSLYGIADNRLDVVGGGYDAKMFTLHKKDKPEPVQLVYAGKLSFAKGVDWLVQTFLGLARDNLHLHLAGSGSGSEAAQCLALAKSGGAAITVHGRISQSELARLMGRSHIFILPSFFEGLPLVLLEALASGCRIISTDLPGCRELLGGAPQDLVEFIQLPILQEIDRPNPADREELQTRLGWAIINMADRVRRTPSPSAEEINRITSVFDWESVFQRIFSAYTTALDKGSG